MHEEDERTAEEQPHPVHRRVGLSDGGLEAVDGRDGGDERGVRGGGALRGAAVRASSGETRFQVPVRTMLAGASAQPPIAMQMPTPAVSLTPGV